MSEEIITVEKVMADMNLDDIGNTKDTITRLISQATATIRMAIGQSITDEDILKENADVYNLLIESLVNSYYFNKSFDGSYTHGQLMWLKNLKYSVLSRLEAENVE